MNFQELLERYYPLLRKHILPLSLAASGLIFLVYGLISLSGHDSASDDITFETANAKNEPTKSVEKIMVDVEGAVVNPGVYSISKESRVQDAMVAAGGLSESADRNWTVAHLNLATKLTDGVKIYIPKVGENFTSSASTTGITSTTGGAVIGASDTQSGLVNINSATADQLDSLPGIGPVTAQKIISNRPYSSIEELKTKKAVSTSVFEKIKSKITVQ